MLRPRTIDINQNRRVVERKLHGHILGQTMRPDKMAQIPIRRRRIRRTLQNLHRLGHKARPAHEIRPPQRNGCVGRHEETGQPCASCFDTRRVREGLSSVRVIMHTIVRGRGAAATTSHVVVFGPRGGLPTQAEIDGHDGSGVDELVELEILKVIRRAVPYHRDEEALHELQALIPRQHAPLGEDLHQFLLQLLVQRCPVRRGRGHDGEEQQGLRPAKLSDGRASR